MQKITRHTTRNIPTSLAPSAVPLFAFAFANDAPPPAPHPADRLHMRMPFSPSPLANLNLNDLQQEKIFALTHTQEPVIFEKEKILHMTMLDLRQLTQSDRFDAPKAKSLAEAHGKAIAELIYLHTETQSKILALLTEAQRKQLEEQQDQHQRR